MVSVTADGFDSFEAASASFSKRGLHLLELSVPPVSNDPHWHSFDAEFYILDGELELVDVASGKTLHCAPGSWVKVPARAVHAERSAGGYRIVLGTSVPATEFGEPVDRDPATLGASI